LHGEKKVNAKYLSGNEAKMENYVSQRTECALVQDKFQRQVL